MGLCGSTSTYKGSSHFEILNSEYQFGVYKGLIRYNPQHFNEEAKYLYVNLVGKESIKSTTVSNSTTFLFVNLLTKKLNGIRQDDQFKFEKKITDFAPVFSNYCRVQGITLSTTIYLESYLASKSTDDPQNCNILPNSRRIYVLKVNKEQSASQIINQIYQPNQQQFNPIAELHFKTNQYRIGDTIIGSLIIDNKDCNVAIISNRFNILQIVEVIQKKEQKKKILPPVIMNSQMLEYPHAEIKRIPLEYKIGQSFTDALSYDGVIYSVNYFLEIIIEWENGQKCHFQEPCIIKCN